MVAIMDSRSGEASCSNVKSLMCSLSPKANVLHIDNWKMLKAVIEVFPNGNMVIFSFMEDLVSRSGKNLSVLIFVARAETTLDKDRVSNLCYKAKYMVKIKE